MLFSTESLELSLSSSSTSRSPASSLDRDSADLSSWSVSGNSAVRAATTSLILPMRPALVSPDGSLPPASYAAYASVPPPSRTVCHVASSIWRTSRATQWSSAVDAPMVHREYGTDRRRPDHMARARTVRGRPWKMDGRVFSSRRGRGRAAVDVGSSLSRTVAVGGGAVPSSYLSPSPDLHSLSPLAASCPSRRFSDASLPSISSTRALLSSSVRILPCLPAAIISSCCLRAKAYAFSTMTAFLPMAVVRELGLRNLVLTSSSASRARSSRSLL